VNRIWSSHHQNVKKPGGGGGTVPARRYETFRGPRKKRSKHSLLGSHSLGHGSQCIPENRRNMTTASRSQKETYRVQKIFCGGPGLTSWNLGGDARTEEAYKSPSQQTSGIAGVSPSVLLIDVGVPEAREELAGANGSGGKKRIHRG